MELPTAPMANCRNPFSPGRYSPDLLTLLDLVGSLRPLVFIRHFSRTATSSPDNALGWREILKSRLRGRRRLTPTIAGDLLGKFSVFSSDSQWRRVPMNHLHRIYPVVAPVVLDFGMHLPPRAAETGSAA